MSSEPLKVGVIGIGGLARSVHLQSLSELPGAEIVALCDIVVSRATEQAERFSVPRTYTVYHEMLAKEDLDAVFVLVEPSNLFHVTVACLEAGLPTYMEKPPGITLYQARSLQRAAEKAGLILQVGFNRRFIPVVRRVIEVMREATQINQVIGRFMKLGDAAFDKGGICAFEADSIHAVDLVRSIADSRPVTAGTVCGQYDGSAVTNAWNSVVQFENGVTGIVQTNYATGGRFHTFEIHGPGASAFINVGFGGAQCEAQILVSEGRGGYSLASSGVGGAGLQTLDGKELAGSEEFYRFYGFYQEDEHFLDCVRQGREPETSIRDAVKTFEMVELIGSSVI
jgi:predicted dehydrogenase